MFVIVLYSKYCLQIIMLSSIVHNYTIEQINSHALGLENVYVAMIYEFANYKLYVY